MIRLESTYSLQLLSGAASQLEFDVSYTNITATEETPAGTFLNTANSTGVFLLLAPPAAGTISQVQWISVINTGSVSNLIKIRKDFGGVTQRVLCTALLRPGERLQYTSNRGFVCYDANGSEKVVTAEDDSAVGRTVDFFKVGTALEAAGVWYSFGKDAGAPGAWSPGTPGVTGRATDGLVAADAGCLPLWNATGSLYIDEFDLWASVATTAAMWDILWVNSGLVVTTLTAQTVNSVAFPARDADDSINGSQILVGILVTTATTNAAAMTNIVLSYTNSLGVAGRTATVASFPATAVVGTVVWFQLAAGDVGIRSIQTVTWPTSLVAGAVSLIAARRVVQTTCTVAALGNAPQPVLKKRRKVSKNAVLIPMSLTNAVTAQTISGTIGVVER